ncbi:hypothetical protein C8R43DRAFT_1193280 [Mycena crocata]|nr:hypothetical protein C8R43DRAFT_1193280 [Mycena crocata]
MFPIMGAVYLRLRYSGPRISTVFISRAVAFYDPTPNGGSMFNNGVIISGLSSPGVLTDTGILNYAQACLGIHLGDPQSVNLGDGTGWVNQTDYGDADVGTCLESLIGGKRFLMVYRRNGTTANSGALFLAYDVFKRHTIVPDGYNIGRDKLVANAVGVASHDDTTYSTVAQNLTGLLSPGSVGWAYFNCRIATDGMTVLLTVTIL